MEDYVVFKYAAPSNVSFMGEYETCIPREEWNEMTDEEKQEAFFDVAFELVEIWEA